jgi:hypothetical protein
MIILCFVIREPDFFVNAGSGSIYDPRPWAWEETDVLKSQPYCSTLYDSLRVLKLVIFLQQLTDLLFASATPTTATVPKATAVPSHTTLISFSGKNSRGGFLLSHLYRTGDFPVTDQIDPDH